MALTRDFKETVQARVQCDATFRVALLREATGERICRRCKTPKVWRGGTVTQRSR